ncbi:unnamed protein product, partial [Prorocentrum cordatum]
ALAVGLLQHFAKAEKASVCSVRELVSEYNHQQQLFSSAGLQDLSDIMSLDAVRMAILNASRRYSAVLYFADLRAAFHAVVREFLVRLPETERGLEEAIDELQLPLAVEGAMRSILAEPTIFEKVGGRHVHDLIRDVNSCTRFQVKGTSEVAKATARTRPGMPPADVLFTLSVAPVHERLRERVFAEGLALDARDFGVDPACAFRPEGDQQDALIGSPSYVDDLAVLQAARAAHEAI